jgi:hypothetical protein
MPSSPLLRVITPKQHLYPREYTPLTAKFMPFSLLGITYMEPFMNPHRWREISREISLRLYLIVLSEVGLLNVVWGNCK